MKIIFRQLLKVVAKFKLRVELPLSYQRIYFFYRNKHTIMRLMYLECQAKDKYF
jgi:hypothetical protein